jgi:hypothetical protein
MTAGLEDSSQYADEWEAFCRADYDAYKAKHPQPFIAHFWSGSAFFNSAEDWSDEWRRHYMRVGEAWWNARGFTVTSWPRRDPITVAPLMPTALSLTLSRTRARG